MEWNIVLKSVISILFGALGACGLILLTKAKQFQLNALQLFYLLSVTIFAISFLVGIDFFPQIMIPLVVAFFVSMLVIRIELELPRFRYLRDDPAYLLNLLLTTTIFFLAIFLVVLGLSGNWHFGSYWAFLLLAVLFFVQIINNYRNMGDRRSWRVLVGILLLIYATAALVVQISVNS